MKHFNARGLLLLLLLPAFSATAAEQAGSVLGVKGEVTARDGSGTDRVLLKEDAVFVGETLITGANAYVVIHFSDGAKATVRPNSQLEIEQYRVSETDSSALLNLVKGGLRAVTGAIAQRQPQAYQVKTPVATLGVRGTEFYLRICEQDCADEQRLYVQNMVEQGTM